jgi:glycerol uptake facilitator protein
MNPYTAEFLGTAILLLLGDGVVANVVLQRTKGHAAGWIVITAGWGFAVYVAVHCVEEFSGAHINPAVTVGLAAAGRFEWSLVPGYILAQMAGAFVGACLVYLLYKDHYDATDDAAAKLATFCTGPAIRNPGLNTLSEIAATLVLVLAVLLTVEPAFADPDGKSVQVGLGSLGAMRVGVIVFAIGLSLGGTTGHAINPARDLAPRIAHALLPIRGKGDSQWSYAWVPVVGPLLGAIIAALIARGISS